MPEQPGCQIFRSQPNGRAPAYRLAFGAQLANPHAADLTLPPIKYTANPDDVQTRADLVVQVDVSGVKRAAPVPDLMIMWPGTDISGAEGALSADYMDATRESLAKMLASYCMKGKVKLSVALVRSSLPPGATDDQVNDKRLSDWLPMVVDFRNPIRSASRRNNGPGTRVRGPLPVGCWDWTEAFALPGECQSPYGEPSPRKLRNRRRSCGSYLSQWH